MLGWAVGLLTSMMMLMPSSPGQQPVYDGAVSEHSVAASDVESQIFAAPSELLRDFSSYLTTPDDMPPITILTSSPEAAEGYIFIAPYARVVADPPYGPYLMILDGSGKLVYYKRVSAPAEDFKKTDNGRLIYTVGGSHTFWVMDEAYETVEVITAQEGYAADFHDVQVLDDGTVLLLIYEARQIDMSEVVAGGDPLAIVEGCRIQGLDQEGQVIFEWTSFDHIPITDSFMNLRDSRIDYVHCNAIERDFDGDLLVTFRNTSEVSKIDWETGGVIWRLGGKGNQFAFVNEIGAQDVGFAMHHDTRRAANGNITLFDNRMGVSNYSRAVEYTLDETNLIATLVWEYRHSPDVHGHIMGNSQRLDNGNTVVGWGSGLTAMSEATQDGQLAFELELPASMQNYRVFKFPWTGRPAAEPTLIVASEVPTVTLTYSWNGATDVAAYRVYGDTAEIPTTLITVEPSTGFETTTVITSMVGGPSNFRVVPLDAFGRAMIADPGWPQAVSYLPLLTR